MRNACLRILPIQTVSQLGMQPRVKLWKAGLQEEVDLVLYFPWHGTVKARGKRVAIDACRGRQSLA
jgi:hypothetical protein